MITLEEFEKEARDRLNNYLHTATNLSPQNCFRHSAAMAKAMRKLYQVAKDIEKEERPK